VARCAALCHTLHLTTTHYNILQHPATHCNKSHFTYPHDALCSTLQFTAFKCNTLPHTVSDCHTMPQTTTNLIATFPYSALCNTLHHDAPRCNTLQRTETHLMLAYLHGALCCMHMRQSWQRSVSFRITLLHTATHCHTLQHTFCSHTCMARCVACTPDNLNRGRSCFRLGLFSN